MKPLSVGTWWIVTVFATATMSLFLNYEVLDALKFAFGFSLGWWTIEALKAWWRNRPRPPYGGAA